MSEIRNDLLSLETYSVVLFGSCVTGDYTSRSDIDIAVITKNEDKSKNSKLLFELLGKIPPQYDLKIFELLPLHVKISVIERYIVIFGNAVDISYYFYKYRKLWSKVRHRYESNLFTSAQEQRDGFERLKRLKKVLKNE